MKYFCTVVLVLFVSAVSAQLRKPQPFVYVQYAFDYLKANPGVTCAKFVDDEGVQVYATPGYTSACPTLQMDRGTMAVTPK